MCGRSICVDDNGVGVIMCLSDVWLEVIFDPLMNSIFIGFLGVIEIDMDVIFEYVDDMVTRWHSLSVGL